MILEREADARRRKVQIYGKILSSSTAGGAAHPGDKVARVISGALKRGGMETIDFIDSAANSSPLLDAVEAEGLKHVLVDRYGDIPLSAFKSMLGEGIASGGVRMAADLLILERGVIPPTINYEYPDPCCGLRVVTEGLHTSIKTILHLGISMDGTYMAVLMERGNGVS
jgi:3-oxoacyl-[acyl-carrier-protein] synthase II